MPDWNEAFELSAAMVRPDRLRAAVEAALKARGIVPGLAVMDGIELKSGVVLDFGEDIHEVKLALEGSRGDLNIFLEEGGKARLDFSAADVEGDPEPLYLLFAELGLALGARPEPQTGADGLADEDLESAITDVLNEYAPGGVTLQALERGGGAGVSVERTSNDLIISIAGHRFRTDGGGGLGDDELEEIKETLTGETADLIDDARRVSFATRPVPADASRAGQFVLDVYGLDGAVRWSQRLDESNREALLEKGHQGDGIPVVTRYFKDGRPFFRTLVDRDETPSFDDLHLYRTWSWLSAR